METKDRWPNIIVSSIANPDDPILQLAFIYYTPNLSPKFRRKKKIKKFILFI